MPEFEPFECPGCGARVESPKVAKFHPPGEHDEPPAPPVDPATPPVETKPGEPPPAPEPTEPAKPRGFDFSTPLADL